MLLFTVLEWASLYRLSTIYSVFELFCNVCFYTNSPVIGTFSCNQVWPDCGQGISSHTERSRVRIRHIQPQSPECVCVSCSVMSDSVASQAPLTMGFSKQEYWSGLSFPTPEDLPYPGIEPWSPALQADSLPFELQGSPNNDIIHHYNTIQSIFHCPVPLFSGYLPLSSPQSTITTITDLFVVSTKFCLFQNDMYLKTHSM